jgi:hypothetical protein
MLTYTLECWKVLAAVPAEIQPGLGLGEPNPPPVCVELVNEGSVMSSAEEV